MKRHCNDGQVFVTDRDTIIVVLDKGRKLRMKMKPTEELRRMINAGNTRYFRNVIDEAVTEDIKRKDAARRNKEELERIQVAAKKGIPTESKIVRVRPDAPPVRVFRIVPWYRRLWARIVRLWTPQVGIATVEPPKKSMMPPAVKP